MSIFQSKPVNPATLALLVTGDERTPKYFKKVSKRLKDDAITLEVVKTIADLNFQVKNGKMSAKEKSAALKSISRHLIKNGIRHKISNIFLGGPRNFYWDMELLSHHVSPIKQTAIFPFSLVKHGVMPDLIESQVSELKD